MVPRFLRFIDRLPKTPSEKVEKYLLKQQGELERESLWDREKVIGRLRNQSTQN
jgi:crotonobetaine/carnitine-CoA ligase